MDEIFEDDVAQDEVAFVVVVGALEVEDQKGAHEDAKGFYELTIGQGLYQQKKSDDQVLDVLYAEDNREDLKDIEINTNTVAECIDPSLTEQRIQIVN